MQKKNFEDFFNLYYRALCKHLLLFTDAIKQFIFQKRMYCKSDSVIENSY